jgi:predicted PurR-regulated permease PerM
MGENRIITIAAGIFVVIVTGLVLKAADRVFFPLFLAIFFYYTLSPVLDLLIRLRIPQTAAVALIVAASFLIFYLLGMLVYSSAKGFVASFPQYGEKLSLLLYSITERLNLVEVNWNPWTWSKGLDVNKITGLVVASLNKFLSFFSTFLLSFVYLIFMLAGRGKLQGKVERSFSPGRAKQIVRILDKIDVQVQRYLAIKSAVSFLSGVVVAAVLAAFGVDFAIVFGAVTFVLNFIPSLGSILSLGLATLATVFQYGSVFPTLWVFLLILVFDTLLGNVLEPKWMGIGLGLSPLVVLFALFFWGWLWGIPGMILAVPLMAVTKIVCSNVPSLQFLAELMSG